MILGFVSESRFETQASVNVSAAGNSIYTTPDVLRTKLRSVANLVYKNAVFSAAVRLPAAATAGAITIRLTDGITDYAALSVNLTVGQLITVQADIDLSKAAGSTPLFVAVDVGTAAAGPASVTIDAALQLEMPTTVTGC